MENNLDVIVYTTAPGKPSSSGIKPMNESHHTSFNVLE